MPQYLVCNYLPDDFDPSTVTEAMMEEIHALNRESFLPGSGTRTRRKQVNNLATAASEHAPW